LVPHFIPPCRGKKKNELILTTQMGVELFNAVWVSFTPADDDLSPENKAPAASSVLCHRVTLNPQVGGH